ncbi:MAG: flavodoxin [Jatrophihabitans sp.]|nr:MAG: flavodoxin [Jatrophihabitans sp.]
MVTAATKYGATGEIAQAIATALTERGVTAVLLPPQQVTALEGYEAFVLGSAVYTGHWLPEAMALVQRGAGSWAGRPVWLFSSGPVGDPGKALTKKMGVDPVDLPKIRAATGAREHRMFPGKLDRKNLSFGQRAGLALFRSMQGDFRDWDAIRDWSAGIADVLHQAPAR